MCNLLKRGVLVGFYSLMLNDPANLENFSPWLGSVFVKPEFRGQGIGTKLVEHALGLTRRIGIDTLYLRTPNKQAMYSRIGFINIQEIEIRGKMFMVMKKQLAEK